MLADLKEPIDQLGIYEDATGEKVRELNISFGLSPERFRWK